MKNIAIVCGGYSGEYVISVNSAKMVARNIDPKRYHTFLIYITRQDWYHETPEGEKYPVDKNDFSIMLPGKKIRFDGVFNAIHGTPGEDGKLQGYFDIMDIPYTSCNAATSALTFNKYFCNRFVNSLGIPTAASVSYLKGEAVDKKMLIEQLGFPMFVKPAESGSSVGITRVIAESEIDNAIRFAFAESDRVVIEENLEGREIACGVFMKGRELIVLPLTEIITQNEFFDYEAKYSEGLSDEITPAEVDEDSEKSIKSVSSYLYHEMDCKGFVRFDYMLTGDGIYFMEVNTIPGITEASIVPKMVKAFGMSTEEFFTLAVDNLFLPDHY
ncbi:MAG: D-alanine--D-alanine ligase [Chlorobi bacterium]|nr:D-alanine--D-alanine ligase [Chlorobiota bacterium]